MPADFDPYYTWLGIPPEEQPPHHYRLLGIRPLEADREVITHAMDQRMAHLRTMQSGKHSVHSQRLLNEVSAAAVVLLDPEKKGAYDRQLANRQEPPTPPAPVATPPVPPPVAEPPLILPAKPVSAIPRSVVIAGLGIAAAVCVLVALMIAVRSWNSHSAVADREIEPGKESAPPVVEPVGVPQNADDPVPPVAAGSPASHPAIPVPQLPPAVVAPAESSLPPNPMPAPPRRVTVARARREAAKNAPPEPMRLPDPAPQPAPPAESLPTEIEHPPLPLPTPEQIEAARAKVIEIYGEEGRQAVKPDQKVALAQRMSQVADETSNDPAVRYALLDAARKLYSAAGEAEPALATASQMADEFDEDGWELRVSTSSAMSDVPMMADKRNALASALVALVDQAVAEEAFDAAEELARLAVKVGNRSADVNIRRDVVQKRSELTRHKDLWQAVEQARDKLSDDPADPAANLVVGKFLCFVVLDFDQGVPHLLGSGRDPFAAAARDDQAAAPGALEAVVRAGDAWYALAESVKSSDKDLVPGALLRARYWYERVVSQLSGLEKARVEKRLQDTAAVADAAAALRTKPASSSNKGKRKRGSAKRKG